MITGEVSSLMRSMVGLPSAAASDVPVDRPIGLCLIHSLPAGHWPGHWLAVAGVACADY